MLFEIVFVLVLWFWLSFLLSIIYTRTFWENIPTDEQVWELLEEEQREKTHE